METADHIRPPSSRQNGIDAGVVSSQFFERTHKSLVQHLKRKLASIEEAEDLAQEACLKLLQTSKNGSNIQNPRAYLYRIAHHLLYHHYKRQSKWHMAGDTDVDAVSTDDATLDDWTSYAQRAEYLNKALRELSPKCQRTMLLRWRDELRVADVADEMNLSRSMVKKYLAQGIDHFRQRLRRVSAAD